MFRNVLTDCHCHYVLCVYILRIKQRRENIRWGNTSEITEYKHFGKLSLAKLNIEVNEKNRQNTHTHTYIRPGNWMY